MHFGATLRLLRLESGLGLRDLARRLGVSGSYLSRVESGVDATPATNRLLALARELNIPPTLLLDLAHQISPLVVDYVERVPEAGSLFLQIAHRRLNASQLAEVRAFIDARFPASAAQARQDQGETLGELLSLERVVLGLSSEHLEDALDVAVGRLAHALPRGATAALAATLKKREAEVPSFIGGGVAVPCACIADATPAAALVTMATPLECATPDGLPLRLMVVLVGPSNAKGHLLRLARIARLAAHGLAERMLAAQTPEQVLQQLALLEAWR